MKKQSKKIRALKSSLDKAFRASIGIGIVAGELLALYNLLFFSLKLSPILCLLSLTAYGAQLVFIWCYISNMSDPRF